MKYLTGFSGLEDSSPSRRGGFWVLEPLPKIRSQVRPNFHFVGPTISFPPSRKSFTISSFLFFWGIDWIRTYSSYSGASFLFSFKPHPPSLPSPPFFYYFCYSTNCSWLCLSETISIRFSRLRNWDFLVLLISQKVLLYLLNHSCCMLIATLHSIWLLILVFLLDRVWGDSSSYSKYLVLSFSWIYDFLENHHIKHHFSHLTYLSLQSFTPLPNRVYYLEKFSSLLFKHWRSLEFQAEILLWAIFFLFEESFS